MISDDKYIVFKRDAFDMLLLDLAGSLNPIVGGALNTFASQQVEDAVVIRRQDVFAPPALDAYANSIRVAIQLAGEQNLTRSNYQTLKLLTQVADYFHEQAVLSWETDRKIPD